MSDSDWVADIEAEMDALPAKCRCGHPERSHRHGRCVGLTVVTPAGATNPCECEAFERASTAERMVMLMVDGS